MAYATPTIDNQTGLSDRDETSLSEKIFVLFAFLIFFGVVRDLLPGGGSDDRTSGSMYFQLVSGSTYLAGMALLLWRGIPRSSFHVIWVALPLIVLTGLALASTMWSQDPGTTLRRAAALVLGSSFAFYLVLSLKARTIFDLLTVACGVFLLINILAVGAGIGVTSGGVYAGAWEGLTGNKNDFGRSVALIAVLMFTVAAVGLVRYRKSAFAIGAISLILVLLSRSATSLISTFAAVGGGLILFILCGGPIFGVRFRAGVRLVAALAALAVGGLVITLVIPPLLEALGRDATLTGRTALWEWAITRNEERWLLGSGYRTFWIDDNTKYFFLDFAWQQGPDGILSDTYAGPTHAHSGYIDIWLELGLTGIILYIIFIISALRLIAENVKQGQFALGFLFSAIITFISIYSITARSILQQADDLWFLVILVYLLCAENRVAASEPQWSATNW